MKKIIFVIALIVFAATSCRLFSADMPGQQNQKKIISLEGKLLPGLPAVKDGIIQLPQWWSAPLPKGWGQTWGTGFFVTGDTTFTFTVVQARVIYLQFQDSSLTGTDSMTASIQNASGGVTMKAPLAWHNNATGTITTNVNFLIPGASVSAVFQWPPPQYVGDQYFSGTISVSRVNVNDNVTPYLPKTRYAYNWE